MCYCVRLANKQEIPIIEKIYAHARQFMQRNGNPTQWIDGYPDHSQILHDIENQFLYLCLADNEILGAFALCGHEVAYDTIHHGQWPNDEPYATIHRIASKKQNCGIASFCFRYVKAKYPNVRIDTHRDNIPMQRLVNKMGFNYCGIIYLDHGEERLAYHYVRPN